MKKTHRDRIVLLVLILSLCISALSAQVFAVTSYVYELETSGKATDVSKVRNKEDNDDAKIIPSNGSHYENGIRYFIYYVNPNSTNDFVVTGYTDRFNLRTFYISYKPAYAKPEQVRLAINSYTQSTSYSVYVTGEWMP